ncbi:hypothetical protein FDI21_gp294 [Pseudomonas phage Noxifer]|uniref:Uncharacterized protein n=1 Tax=Pseudomonas phage Noxifer TaxID=2006684 RepID=A0A1Y0T3G0_9CAUD|nr:hypothetical protein FDI21_gp294 [Pseudomonas phage Noxifer]ARV77417.1 hypothetical protein NOXIFER_252 [Pseudomonas phage Noxifer]
MKADKESPLGQALNRAATEALEGRPDVLHQPRVDFIEKVLDARDDAYEDFACVMPPEFHEPVHKAITSAVVKTLGVLDDGYVLLPSIDRLVESEAAYLVVPIRPHTEGPRAIDTKTFNVAGDLAVIFSTIYDDVNN